MAFKKHFYRNLLLMFALIVIATNTNYAIGSLVGVSRQGVSTIVAMIIIAYLIIAMVLNKLTVYRSVFLIAFGILLITFVFPSLGYFVNSGTGDLSEYVFWVKRQLLVVFFILAVFPLSNIPQKQVHTLAIIVLAINTLSIYLSYIFPEYFLMMIDPSDPMIQAGLNFVGGGFFVSSNGAGFAALCSYCAYYFTESFEKKGFALRHLVISFIFITSLAITGSRSNFATGVIIFAILNFNILIKQLNSPKILWVFLAVVLTAATLTSNQFSSDTNFNRIIHPTNEGDLESNQARYSAAVAGLNLFASKPFLGYGFGLRNQLLRTQPHNMYIAYFIDCGLFLGLAFPLSVVLLYLYARKYMPLPHLRALVFVILAMSFFDHGILYSKQFGYLMLMALYAINLSIKSRKHILSVGVLAAEPHRIPI